MNWLYYHGRFGEISKTKTIPWGTGPVLTAGKACMTADRKTGAKDLLAFDSKGRILNNHDGTIPAVVHQYDRCAEWMNEYISNQPFMDI
jgi:hypothetical protein